MRILLAALALTAAVPALAQQPAAGDLPGQPTAARVQAGTYAVDPNHTQVLFTVNHLGFSEYTGQFVEPTGTLVLDPAKIGATKLTISFPIAKVRTSVAALDAHLQKPEFFDAAKFPNGTFVATKVESLSGMRALIAGKLTLKGVTRPVILTAHFVGMGTNPMSKKATIGFEATTTIKRSDWGVSYIAPLVSDTVKLTINAAFERE